MKNFLLCIKYGINVGTMKDTFKKVFLPQFLLMKMIGVYGNT